MVSASPNPRESLCLVFGISWPSNPSQTLPSLHHWLLFAPFSVPEVKVSHLVPDRFFVAKFIEMTDITERGAYDVGEEGRKKEVVGGMMGECLL